MSEPFVRAVERHLDALVTGHPDRHPGRPGNTAANDYAEQVLNEHGWSVDSVDFEALDCETGAARLSVDGRDFEVLPGPYTLPVETAAPLLPIDSLEALEALERARLAGSIVLLHGAIAADQLFPKSFDFVDAPEHRRIYGLLEAGAPAAVIGATGRGGGMGGGLYPYPLIEDGDFDIPNAYTTEEIGRTLVTLAGRPARLMIEAERRVLPARQLTAARGPSGAPRALVIAHIDSKGGSPGAIDNATGVAALLAVAQLLEDYEGPYRAELIPMNGEDYYASSGEHLFVAANEGRWDELLGTVNMDAIGARDAGTALSMYAVTERGNELIHRVLRRHPSVTIGEAWYESDHSIVAAQGRPTVALTSTSFRELCATITHTERDTLELVDADEVAAVAEFVADFIRALPAIGGSGA
jgi:aminopeptidase YwaD